MKNVIDLTQYLPQELVMPQTKRRFRPDLSALAEGVVSLLLGCCILISFALLFAII